jgi:hypothetical protein
LAELFADEGNLDSNSLKASRIYFARDFDGYIDNLLTPEKRALWPVNIRGNFCIAAVLMATATTHCLGTIHNHFLFIFL